MAALSAVAAAVLASCTTWRVPPPHLMGPGGPFESTALHQWWGDGVPGSPSIRINLATQKAHFLRNGRPVGWTTVATGTPDYPTHPGSFRILNKEVDKVSNTYGMIIGSDGDVIDRDARRGREAIPEGARFAGAPMPYWMQITSYGVGMHAGVIPRPGRPASHGCIRLPREMAIKFFQNAPVGTPVTVVHRPGEADPFGQWNAGYAERARAEPRRESSYRPQWRRRRAQSLNPGTWFGGAPRIEQSRRRSRG